MCDTDQILNSQNTPHALLPRASYGMYLEYIGVNDRDMAWTYFLHY